MYKIRIGDYFEVFDGAHATPKKTDEGPVYLGIDAVTNDGKINPSGYAHLSEEDYVKWSKRIKPQYGDLVFSYEATLGRYALIPKDFYGCLGRRLALLRAKNNCINIKWLYYYFLSPEWNAYIINHTVKGSTVNRISVEDFPDFEIPYIDRGIQDRIVNVLSAIDAKIDSNVTINDNLQQQLKLLYDYWFTQFDFPDENGKPYRSSGGTMVWNEQLKREVPFDWQITGIKEITNITWGQCPDGKNILDKTAQGNNVFDYCSGAGDMKGGFLVDCQAKTDNSKRLAHKNDILVSVAGKIGDMCVVDHTISLGRAAMAYTVKDEKEITFVYLTLQALNRKMTTISTGSIQKVINSDHIDDFIFPYQKDIVLRFGELTQDIYFELIKLSHENRQLKKLRDWLLPMLMNGQATISD